MKDFLGNDVVAGNKVIFRIGSFEGLVEGEVIFVDDVANVKLDVSRWMNGRALPNNKVVNRVRSVDIYRV